MPGKHGPGWKARLRGHWSTQAITSATLAHADARRGGLRRDRTTSSPRGSQPRRGAWPYGRSGDNAGATDAVQHRWDALLDHPGADAALLQLGKVLGLASGRVGSERRDVLDRRIQIAERMGDREHLADALTALAISYSTTAPRRPPPS